LLERLLTTDINQMPVVSGAADEAPQIVGMVTRDSILRVMETVSELASRLSGKQLAPIFNCAFELSGICSPGVNL
jgi:hypothetical protein